MLTLQPIRVSQLMTLTKKGWKTLVLPTICHHYCLSLNNILLQYSPKYGNTFRSVAGIWWNTRALPEGYNHLQVNHSVHFLDPVNQACINHVENMCISHEARCGTQSILSKSIIVFARIYAETTIWKESI